MRTIGRLLLSAIFLVLTALLVLAAKYAPALVFSFYPELSRKALGVISSVTRAVPLAVWELLAGLAILWLLYTFVRIFTQHRSFLCWLAGIVLGVCVGLFVFAKEHLNFPNLSEKCHRCIRALSRWSFGAYLVHPLFIESFDIFLHFNTLSLNVFFSVPLLTLIIGALSFLVSALLHQIPFVKKYFV